ncbi:tetratricopeptide repeat protein [Siminovitchia sp. 179-K 8D1 HS]|uniref:tetratricopeptide repeat protein n=1 Tax=Siminovitchia sp. 179-K 8D1 HS TaxID=3142385 RepID=UPI0039A145D2
MKKDNVILFPGLGERLFRKGIDCLENHQYADAVQLLQQAKEMAPEDPQISKALVIALYEKGDYGEAKGIAKEMLLQGTGDFYEVFDLYLMILIQLHRHDEVVLTLETLFEEQHVPEDKREHYQTLLNFSKKTAVNKKADSAEKHLSGSLFKGSLQEQVVKLSSLADKNIQPYFKALIALLKNNQSHPFLQTVALNVLKEHRIDQKVEVRKLGFSGVFNPSKLPELTETVFFQSVQSELEKKLEHENPVLMMQVKEIIKRHQFLLYPFEPEEDKLLLWTAAYHGYSQSMYGESWNKTTAAEKLGVEETELDQVLSFLDRLERVSERMD